MTDAIDLLLAQHARAEEQFRLVRENSGEARRDPQFLPRLDAFRAAVLMHATREERYEFPQLRARVPQTELTALVPALRAAEALAPTRPHPGAESAPANLLAGLPLAVLDRVKDLVRDALKANGHKPDE